MKSKWTKVKRRKNNARFVLVEVMGNKIIQNKQGFVPVRSYNGTEMYTETVRRDILDNMYNTDAYL